MQNAECKMQKSKLKYIHHGLKPYRNFAICILKFDLCFTFALFAPAGLIIFIMGSPDNMVNDLPRGLLDGFIRRVDDRPVPVFFDEAPYMFDLGKDLPELAVARLEPGVFLAHRS